jgi:hypothetical protein
MQGGGAAHDPEHDEQGPDEERNDEPESAEERLEEGERPGDPGTKGAGQGSDGGAV